MQTTIELQPKRGQHLARWKQLGADRARRDASRNIGWCQSNRRGMAFHRVCAGARGTEPARLGTGTRDLCRGPVTVELGRGDGREARSLLRGRSEGSMAVRVGWQDNVLRARAICSLRNL